MTKTDLFLYWYTLIFSVFLIVTALLNGFNLNNLTILALFLPVPAYLLLQTTKRYHLKKHHPSSANQAKSSSKTPFHLKKFLTQPHPLFIISFVLLLSALLISLIKSL